jgi:hypothetical protein
VQRLLRVVEERLRCASAESSADVHALEALPLPAAPEADEATFAAAEAIQHLPAPLFDAPRRAWSRLAKRLNIPLRIAMIPQRYQRRRP